MRKKSEPSDNAVLLETIHNLGETRERLGQALGRASGHITAARVHQHGVVVRVQKMRCRGHTIDFDMGEEERYLAALVAAEKEIADENPRDGC